MPGDKVLSREGNEMKSCIAFLLVGFSLCLVISCGTQPNPVAVPKPQEAATAKAETDNNQALLEEVNSSGKWFHAKKTRPIWAQEIKVARKVTTLEGEETVEPGHFLCRGEAGDIWPQKKADLEKKYVATEEEKDGWRKYLPRPDAQGVLAAAVEHPFVVHAKWGKLTGKAGDFLIKNFADKETDFPADVWLVDQKLFIETYERVPEKDK
jgi:hypothetical protein